MDRPRISVVVSTPPGNEDPISETREVLAALERQGYPRDLLEVIVALAGDERDAEAARPGLDARVLAAGAEGYFDMKRAGAAAADGDVIAFLDSDCIPDVRWAERIAVTIAAGADVVAGRTDYEPPLARTLALFDFGHVVSSRTRGGANSFVGNNVGIRREILAERTFDRRFRRSAAEYLLARQLQGANRRLAFDSEVRVVHHNPGWRGFVKNRIRAGHDAVTIPSFDEGALLAETRLRRLGVAAPLAVWAARVLDDWRRLLLNHRPLGIRLYEVPWFLLVVPVMRGIEVVGGVIEIARPGYFRARFGW